MCKIRYLPLVMCYLHSNNKIIDIGIPTYFYDENRWKIMKFLIFTINKHAMYNYISTS